MKRILLTTILVIIVVQLLSSKEEFTNQINKLDFKQIKIVPINKENIDTPKPLVCFDNFCLYLINKIYSLIDESTFLAHSKYHQDTKECDFVYLTTILNSYPKNINNVCIFGFGLGGLPLGLSKNDNIKQIDCVDINIHMFELFKTINENPSKKINYYLNDVNDYIRLSENKYDMIVDDTFGADKVFVDYKLVKNILNSNGILFINLIKYETVINLVEKLKKTYSNVSFKPVNFNWLITCLY
jgi:hypothetical protein